jgi:ABC-2 type transport system permease protein
MRTILFILQKEFIQIFRNRSMLPIIFVVPIVQLIVLVHAATFEMKNIKLFVVDSDLSFTSRQLTSKFGGSPFFKIADQSQNRKEADDAMQNGDIDAILSVPIDFEKKLYKENRSDIQLVVNAINGTSAGLVNVYSAMVIADFNKGIILKMVPAGKTMPSKTINTTWSFWYNPELNFKTFMVPGVLVLLVTIIGFMLSGMNVVREKEIGTIEQINVTPIKKYQFITGKLLPFWILALFELAFGLTIGKLLFDIPLVGNLGLVFLVASVYLLVILGIGLFVSTVTNTQQQAMFVSFFFMMIFILMSGLFTSVESMPLWAQQVDKLNPVAYFIRIIRMVLLKGSGFTDIQRDFFSLLFLAAVILSLSVWRYKKRAA